MKPEISSDCRALPLQTSNRPKRFLANQRRKVAAFPRHQTIGIGEGVSALEGFEEPAIEKTHSEGEWPLEPPAFGDLPVMRAGQPYEDWLISYDNWMASLSPLAVAEVATFRGEMKAHLRSRTWKLCRKYSLKAVVVVTSTLLLGDALGLLKANWFEAVTGIGYQMPWYVTL